MDLDGFYRHVFLMFFKADADKEIPLSPRHTVLDVAVTRQGLGGSGALWAERGFLQRALRLIRQNRIATIQANDPYLSGLNALILSRLGRVPYVIEVVSDYDLSYRVAGKRPMPYLPSRAMEKRIERLVFRNASAVYAWNDYYLRYAVRNGACADYGTVVRGVTDEFFYKATPQHPLSAYLSSGDRKVLLYVGRLSGEKYPLDLIDCLAAVRAGGHDALLVIAGDGPMRAEVERRAEERGVRHALTLLGHRSAQELVDLMHGADVLLATHAGYALLEEALSGTPIVAYDYEWHPEVIHHEETGLLAPYRDAEAMAHQTLRLLEDQEKGRALGAAAREFVLNNHDPSFAVRDERQLYERMLGA